MVLTAKCIASKFIDIPNFEDIKHRFKHISHQHYDYDYCLQPHKDYLVLGVTDLDMNNLYVVLPEKKPLEVDVQPAVFFDMEWQKIPADWKIMLTKGLHKIKILPQALAAIDHWFERYLDQEKEVVEKTHQFAREMVIEYKRTNLRERFEKLFGHQKDVQIDWVKIEQDLDLKLPKAFKDMTRFYNGNYDFKGEGKYCYTVNSFPENIVSKTLFFREKPLPENFVVLGEPGDNVVLMETTHDDKNGHILILSYADTENLCYSLPLEEKPTVYESFYDFFDYLLTEEEKIRG